MSRAYQMDVYIEGFDRSREDAIKAAAGQEWTFDNWDDDGKELHGYGDDSLCAGVGEEEFAKRLGKAIWKANQAFCQITVDATYLELLPHETHCLNEDDYARLMGGSTESNTPEDESDT